MPSQIEPIQRLHPNSAAGYPTEFAQQMWLWEKRGES
jgi:hypothetical protein